MASFQMDALKFRANHTVGHINSHSTLLRTVMNGATVDMGSACANTDLSFGYIRAGMDNFVIGEIVYNPTTFGGVSLGSGSLVSDSDRGVVVKVPTATATKNELVLVATPEERLEGEPLSNFYNAHGEKATCYYLTAGLNFETSKFANISGQTAPKVGQYAYWDVTNKTFQISASYPTYEEGTGDNKVTKNYPVVFRVVGFEDDTYYSIDEKELVQLEVLA